MRQIIPATQPVCCACGNDSPWRQGRDWVFYCETCGNFKGYCGPNGCDFGLEHKHYPTPNYPAPRGRERNSSMEGLTAAPMPPYQSHKKVWALKIASVENLGTDTTTDENPIVCVYFEDPFLPRTFNLRGKPTPEAGWYYVQYEGGYESFSPAEAFEKGYTLIPTEPAVAPPPADLRSFMQAEIDNWFTYHAPSGSQLAQYQEIRTAARIFAETINRHVPAGPDKTAAIRKLREAMMTANAGIACHVERPGNV